MTMTREPGTAIPDAGTPTSGDRHRSLRILVPIRSADQAAGPLAAAARVCDAASATLCLLHVRIYDPPARGSGRFYPQTKSAAAAIPDEALPIAWGYGLRATTAVITARRGDIAPAIAGQAFAWHADLIIMTRRPGPALCRLVLGSVPDQVMREANCPVLAVRPARAARSPRLPLDEQRRLSGTAAERQSSAGAPCSR